MLAPAHPISQRDIIQHLPEGLVTGLGISQAQILRQCHVEDIQLLRQVADKLTQIPMLKALPVNQPFTSERQRLTRQHLQQGALAATGRPLDQQHVALLQGDGHVFRAVQRAWHSGAKARQHQAK